MAREESKSKNLWIMAIALICLLVISVLPTPEGLTVEGQRTIAIFVMAVILWMTTALPLSVTGILVFTSLPLLGVMDATKAYSLFGNPAVFFILGAFILAAAMLKTGLSKRISLLILRRFDRSPRMLIAGVLLTSASMSFIIPEHAVAAIMFPVVLDIAEGLDLEPRRSKYGTLLFVSLAWGAIIGGIATLLGGARNALAIGLLNEYYGLEISFFGWIIAAAPLTLVMLGVAYAVLLKYFKIDVKDVSRARRVIEEGLKDKGSITLEEKKVAYVMVLTLFFWIFLTNRLGLANIALLASVILFVIGVMEWKDIEGYVNWGIILMYGGAIALGSALVTTGAADWIAGALLSRSSLTPITFVLALAFVAKFLTEGISNVATVAILLPLGFSIGSAMGVNPVATVYMVALPSGLAFMLPVGTPPNAIAYSSGYYEISDILKPGLILNIFSWIVFVIMAVTYWPAIGLRIL